MGRQRKDYPPSTEPTHDDLVWAAAIFSVRGRDAVVNGQLVVMVHTGDTWILERLTRCFGGAVYAFGSTARWQVNYERLTGFLTAVMPFLSPSSAARAAVTLEAAAAHMKRTATVQALEEERFDSLYVVPHFAEDGEPVLFLTVPEDGAPQAFRAGRQDVADAFAAAALQTGRFAIERKGPLVVLLRRLRSSDLRDTPEQHPGAEAPLSSDASLASTSKLEMRASHSKIGGAA